MRIRVLMLLTLLTFATGASVADTLGPTTINGQLTQNGKIVATTTGGGFEKLLVEETGASDMTFKLKNASAAGEFRLNAAGTYFAFAQKAIVFQSGALGGAFPIIFNASGNQAIYVTPTGNVGMGTGNPAAKLHVANGDMMVDGEASVAVLEIRGQGNDLAEGFVVHSETTEAQPGMVVSISQEKLGDLEICSKPYDRTVAGIISGAGDRRVGIQLGNSEEVANGDLTPVALTGQVWCWVDAQFGAVRPGDMLTTSATPGHAMKVIDYARAQGATIGKAMSALPAGRGLVLVLVSLQ